MYSFFEGFFLGISLIAAIGAQNLFVLRQGLLRQHVFMVASLTAICDFLMIGIGTMGIGSLFANISWLRVTMVIGGIFFLGYYAFKSFSSAMKGNANLSIVSNNPVKDRNSLILNTLAFSLFNPHAVLDTVVIIGGFSSQFADITERWLFAMGAGTSSVVWFFPLAYGAQFLVPIFQKPVFTRYLDGTIGFMMCFVIYSLIKSEL
jgi:L-lysine exporter family protein LysE/ArgO